MSPLDYIILAVLAIALFFALRSMIRRKRSGGCIGCSGNCSACSKKNTDTHFII